ncbi:MAG: hypothetical protein FJ309_01020 [Planctomycetes bacterium]|nr:hypothetical protein [Planctomycetota bacterium]
MTRDPGSSTTPTRGGRPPNQPVGGWANVRATGRCTRAVPDRPDAMLAAGSVDARGQPNVGSRAGVGDGVVGGAGERFRRAADRGHRSRGTGRRSDRAVSRRNAGSAGAAAPRRGAANRRRRPDVGGGVSAAGARSLARRCRRGVERAVDLPGGRRRRRRRAPTV